MVATREVDLFTFSSRLQDLIITNYPRELFEDQCHVDDTGFDKRMYCFYDLPVVDLLHFLDGINEEYEVTDSRTGDVVKVNRLEGGVKV